MNYLTRDQLKKIFKKVKKLRLPKDLEQVNFDDLKYYSWLDQSDMTMLAVYEFGGVPTGIKFDVVQPPAGALRLGFCEFCHKHRKQSEVFFISAKTRKIPKGVNYRSRGTWVCAYYEICNKSLKDNSRIEEFFRRILDP